MVESSRLPQWIMLWTKLLLAKCKLEANIDILEVRMRGVEFRFNE